MAGLHSDYTAVSPEGRQMIESANEKDGENHPLQFVTFSMVTLGIAEISDKTLDEVQYRFAAYQRALGSPFKAADGSPVYVTPDELTKLKGLKMPVVPKTRTAFSKWLADLAAQQYAPGTSRGAFAAAAGASNGGGQKANRQGQRAEAH